MPKIELNGLSITTLTSVSILARPEQTSRAGIALHPLTLEFTFRRTVEKAAQRFRQCYGELPQLQAFEKTVGICATLPFEVNLWLAQNIYFEVTQQHAHIYRDLADAGDIKAQLWLATAAALEEKLHVDSKRLAERAWE